MGRTGSPFILDGIMSVSSTTSAISESWSPSCERSLRFAEPMMTRRSSTIISCSVESEVSHAQKRRRKERTLVWM